MKNVKLSVPFKYSSKDGACVLGQVTLPWQAKSETISVSPILYLTFVSYLMLFLFFSNPRRDSDKKKVYLCSCP